MIEYLIFEVIFYLRGNIKYFKSSTHNICIFRISTLNNFHKQRAICVFGIKYLNIIITPTGISLLIWNLSIYFRFHVKEYFKYVL